MSKYYIDDFDGNVYDQNHQVADPVKMLKEIERLKAELTSGGDLQVVWLSGGDLQVVWLTLSHKENQ